MISIKELKHLDVPGIHESRKLDVEKPRPSSIDTNCAINVSREIMLKLFHEHMHEQALGAQQVWRELVKLNLCPKEEIK